VQFVAAMTRRSAIAVCVLTFLTFGLYGLFWYWKTKTEMNQEGAQIPTTLLLLIPIVGIYWQWKFCEGVDVVTRSRMSAPVALLLLWVAGPVGIAIIQHQLNGLDALPEARLA
jgi:hypothetical protein